MLFMAFRHLFRAESRDFEPLVTFAAGVFVETVLRRLIPGFWDWPTASSRFSWAAKYHLR